MSSQLNGLGNSDRVESILDGNNYQSADILFPFCRLLVSKGTEYIGYGELTKATCIYSELVFDICEIPWIGREVFNGRMKGCYC